METTTANTKAKKIGKNTFQLCVGLMACPKVRFYKKTVVIVDDYGGKVKMKKDEFKLIHSIPDSQ